MASQLISAIVTEIPNVASERILQTTQQLIASSLIATEEPCDKSSLVVVEWEALPSYIDSWVCGLGTDDVLKQVHTSYTCTTSGVTSPLLKEEPQALSQCHLKPASQYGKDNATQGCNVQVKDRLDFYSCVASSMSKQLDLFLSVQ